MADSISSFTAANKAAWNASASLHSRGAEWDSLLEQAARPDFSVLDPELRETIRALGLEGKSAAQVGCNNARELLSLASLKVIPSVGIDQSGAVLEQGRVLAKAAGLEPRLIEADIYDLPDDVGTFDLVLVTIGVLNWMPDIGEFFRHVAQVLKPGGQLVIYETHPFLEMVDPDGEDPYRLATSYFRAEPFVQEEPIVYVGKVEQQAAKSYWFVHNLGAIFSGAIGAGLNIAHFKEYAHSNREELYDQYLNQQAQLPMCFTLVATKA